MANPEKPGPSGVTPKSKSIDDVFKPPKPIVTPSQTVRSYGSTVRSFDVALAGQRPGSDSLALKIPTTSLGKRKQETRTVLEEDEYLNKLETIIQRDFFPDIPKLKAQNEYLEAVDKNDVSKIRELQLRYSTRRTEQRTQSPTRRRSPETFETPGTESLGKGKDDTDELSMNPEAPNETPHDFKTSKKAKVEKNESVDTYLAKFTSEDNASFGELEDLRARRDILKHSWMYKAELDHNVRKINRAPKALAAADEQLALEAPKPSEVDNWGYVARNTVLFNPEGAEFTEEERIQRMKMNDRKIIHAKTRLDENPFRENPTNNRLGKAAIIQSVVNKGKVDASGTESGGILPANDKYGFVVTPSPAPGVEDSPFMTWGEIEGTPFCLDASDRSVSLAAECPNFKMPEIPLRDKLAQSMTDEVSKRYRDRKKKAVDQAAASRRLTPRFGSVRSMERLQSMSPAARRLATSKLGIRIGSDKALQASYTPSPRRPSTGHKTPLAVTPIGKSIAASVKVAGKAKPSETPSNLTSLTDNLLKLPNKRASAADFF